MPFKKNPIKNVIIDFDGVRTENFQYSIFDSTEIENMNFSAPFFNVNSLTGAKIKDLFLNFNRITDVEFLPTVLPYPVIEHIFYTGDFEALLKKSPSNIGYKKFLELYQSKMKDVSLDSLIEDNTLSNINKIFKKNDNQIEKF